MVIATSMMGAIDIGWVQDGSPEAGIVLRPGIRVVTGRMVPRLEISSHKTVFRKRQISHRAAKKSCGGIMCFRSAQYAFATSGIYIAWSTGP